MTNQEICENKIKEAKILFTYNDKGKYFKQLYTVNMNNEILIGGTNEKGYMLRLWPENNPTSTCMTYTDILNILRGKVIRQHSFEVRIVK